MQWESLLFSAKHSILSLNYRDTAREQSVGPWVRAFRLLWSHGKDEWSIHLKNSWCLTNNTKKLFQPGLHRGCTWRTELFLGAEITLLSVGKAALMHHPDPPHDEQTHPWIQFNIHPSCLFEGSSVFPELWCDCKHPSSFSSFKDSDILGKPRVIWRLKLNCSFFLQVLG